MQIFDQFISNYTKLVSMSNHSQSIEIKKPKRLIRSILLSGLLVGLLDGAAAVISAYFPKGTKPVIVFQYIASGVFGSDAFSEGYASAFAGLIFHFTIALGWTALFFLLYPRVRILSWNKIVVGIVYGIFVLLAMKFVVLPLSQVTMINPRSVEIRQAIIHMVCVGLPISLLANRYYSIVGKP